ncbi:MAG TPA: P-loop NTPase [Micromonosporaceae bacterium]
MTILYEPHRRDAQQFALLLGSDAHLASNPAELAAALDESPNEVLAVLGPGVELADALALAAEVRVSRPGLGVVLIRDRLDVNVLGEALRAGIREVVAANDPAGLLAACARSVEVSRQMDPVNPRRRRVPAPPAYQAQVITVFSAKGGCGKTTLATNLAVALAAGGARRVALIDLDLAFGDVAIMLQLVPERSIADAVALGDQLDQTTVRALFTPYAPGLDTLLAPAGPAEAERVTHGVVAEVLRLARGLFDFLVVDTPSQFSEPVLAALDATQVHLLPTTPDIAALKNLRLTLDTFDLLGLPKEHRLVVLNRSETKVGLTAADVERVIRVPIAAHIPSSRDVPVAANRGVPLLVDNPQHPVSKAVRDFALTRVSQSMPNEPAARGLRARLSRNR